jgi:hypothetical protein
MYLALTEGNHPGKKKVSKNSSVIEIYNGIYDFD